MLSSGKSIARVQHRHPGKSECEQNKWTEKKHPLLYRNSAEQQRKSYHKYEKDERGEYIKRKAEKETWDQDGYSFQGWVNRRHDKLPPPLSGAAGGVSPGQEVHPLSREFPASR